LFLNIWTPTKGTKTDNLPVLFFIHGGSFTTGSGDEYTGDILATKHNVVVVTINYRLSHLGWLQPVAGAANFGLTDQRAGLQWCKDQISAFGGDPHRIMLFGESAGGGSVLLHMTTAKSKGLFATAIVESGYGGTRSQQRANQMTKKYLHAAGCSTVSGGASGILKCLRSKPVAVLQAASRDVVPDDGSYYTDPTWGPVQDFGEILEDPVVAFSKGDFHRNVSLIAGANTNEGTVFVYPAFAKPMTPGE
jgi:para-nitrobenzyl esterase